MNILDRVLVGVGDHPDAPGATMRMLHNLAEQVRNTSNNPSAVDQMADMIHASASHIVGQVFANTPVVTAMLHPDAVKAQVEKAETDAKTKADADAHAAAAATGHEPPAEPAA
jgi:hypothetical protein